jgi:spore germination protein GerM
LNSSFVIGGGTESLYKRLYQLIKTVKLNTDLPVYLFIDGQKADVVGGEGIMLSQPLSNSSLDN